VLLARAAKRCAGGHGTTTAVQAVDSMATFDGDQFMEQKDEYQWSMNGDK
jgi:hypothetical protein